MKRVLGLILVGITTSIGGSFLFGALHDAPSRARQQTAGSLGASFSVFRKQRAHGDLPLQVRRSWHGLASKRVAIMTSTGRGWVAQNDHGICVAMPDPVDGSGIACTPLAVAQSQGALVMMAKGDRFSGTLVLPRGALASRVRNDQTAALQPDHDGVVMVKMRPGDALMVTDANGHSSRTEAPAAAPTAPSRVG
jgi:hypothetical protein